MHVKMTKNDLRRMILKEMILRECACQDQEYDDEAAHGMKFHNNGPEEESGMIRSNLHMLSNQAKEIHDMIGMNDDLDEWVQEKIAVASSMIDSVYEYIGYEYKSMRGETAEHDSFSPEYEFSIEDDAADNDFEDEEFIQEVAPPGGEDVVKALKGKKGIKNPYAVAWSMHNKGEDLDEDDMVEPWEPLRQSTGIMFFEDELRESNRRRRR